MIGRYIDLLPESGRDRIVTAQGWCVDILADGDGSGCLRGHGEGFVETGRRWESWCWSEHPGKDCVEAITSSNYPDITVGPYASMYVGDRDSPPARFNRAVRRFGKARVVRAIKKRAGAPLPAMPSVPAGAREGQEVGA